MRKGGNAWWGYDPFSDKKQRSDSIPQETGYQKLSYFQFSPGTCSLWSLTSRISITFRCANCYSKKNEKIIITIKKILKVELPKSEWVFWLSSPFDLNKSTLNSKINASEHAYSVLLLHVKLAAEITYSWALAFIWSKPFFCQLEPGWSLSVQTAVPMTPA